MKHLKRYLPLIVLLHLTLILAESHPGAYWGPSNTYRIDGITAPSAANANIPQASSFAVAPSHPNYADKLTVIIRAWRLTECFYAGKAKDSILSDYSVNITFTAPNYYPADVDYATSKHKAVKTTSGVFYSKPIYTSFDGTHSYQGWFSGSAHNQPSCPHILPDED